MSTYRKQIQSLFLAALVVIAAACSPSPAGSGDPTGTVEVPPLPIALEKIDWTLKSYGPAGAESELLPGTEITLRLEEGQLSGSAGCNSYFGDYQWSGESLTVGMLGQTEMWCEPQERMDQESATLALLGGVESVRRDGERLILAGPDGRLTFVEPEPVADQPVVGTVWQLETLVTGDAAQSVVAGSRITLEFGADGRVGGSAGCNSYGSRYTLAGEALSLDLFETTLMACLDEAVMAQEADYLALLQGATTVDVEGELLTLRSEAGELIYRPAMHLSLEGVDWVLTGIATPEAVVQTWIDETITARFEAGKVTGSAGCNTYFAATTVEGATLTLGPAGSTRMACEEEIMAREAEFLGALENVASYETRLETLSLYDAEGNLLLQFHAAE